MFQGNFSEAKHPVMTTVVNKDYGGETNVLVHTENRIQKDERKWTTQLERLLVVADICRG